jgi:hypothetical protein
MGGSCTKDKFIKDSVYEINNSGGNLAPGSKNLDQKCELKEDKEMIGAKEKEEVKNNLK